jgi:hypothetical protein
MSALAQGNGSDDWLSPVVRIKWECNIITGDHSAYQSVSPCMKNQTDWTAPKAPLFLLDISILPLFGLSTCENLRSGQLTANERGTQKRPQIHKEPCS